MPHKLKSILSSIRYKDVLIFQSPTIIGLIMFFPEGSLANAPGVFILITGSFLLMAYIFCFNDWADINLDYQNPQKHKDIFLDKGVTREEMLILSGFLAAASAILLGMISKAHLLAAIIIILFGLAYSLPVRGIKGKGIPIFSSLLHFGTTLLAFLLGSMSFSSIDARALLIGSYFGILISAGHLVQEVQDYNGDRLVDDWTNALRFGQKPVFFASFLLFGFSFLFLFWLAQAGLVPNIVKYVIFLYPIYTIWAIKAYRAGLDRESIKNLRRQYRILFAISTFVLLSAVITLKTGF